MEQRVSLVTLGVADLDRAVAFYRSLGWEPGNDVARQWKAAPVPAKREIARFVCSPALLGELRVTRSPRPGHVVLAADRVVWRQDT